MDSTVKTKDTAAQNLGAAPSIDKAAEARALETFTAYFLKNYPPDCTISRPAWHAPKIFRAALYAIEEQRSTASGGPTKAQAGNGLSK